MRLLILGNNHSNSCYFTGFASLRPPRLTQTSHATKRSSSLMAKVPIHDICSRLRVTSAIVPIIVVFTQSDVFTERPGEQCMQNGMSSQDVAETEIKKRYIQVLDALTKVIKNAAGQKHIRSLQVCPPQAFLHRVDLPV